MKIDSNRTNQRQIAKMALEVGIVLILLPVLPIAVGLNIFDAANKLSGLPGVKQEGGFLSAFSIFALIILILGIAIAGLGIMSGGEPPFIGGDDREKTPTAIPTEKQTEPTETISSPTPTATPESTSTPTFVEKNPELGQFEQQLQERMSTNPPEYVEAPILATKYRERTNRSIELWLIFDEIEPETNEEAEDMRTQWLNIGIWYSNNVGEHSGQKPDRLVAVGLNEKFNNTHFTIPTEEAQAVYDGEMNKTAYESGWWNRMSGHDEDSNISVYARELVEKEGIRTPTDSRDG